MTRPPLSCSKKGCSKPLYLGGLCKCHYDEGARREQRRDAAVRTLHSGTVDGRVLNNEELRAELLRLLTWWHRACDAVNYGRKDPVLRDEAEYAVEWCIALAQEISDAELAFRNGENPTPALAATRVWVWDRFRNLEAGLMSNGIERS